MANMWNVGGWWVRNWVGCEVVFDYSLVPSRSGVSRVAQHRTGGFVVRAEHSGRRTRDHARDGKRFVGGGENVKERMNCRMESTGF